MKRFIGLVISVFVVIAVVVGAYSYSEAQKETECSEDTYMNVIGSLLDEWNDAVELASSTSSTALAPRISELRNIRLRTQDISVPRCAGDAQAILIGHMHVTIGAFTAVLDEKGEAEVEEKFDDVSFSFREWRSFVEDLGEEPNEGEE